MRQRSRSVSGSENNFTEKAEVGAYVGELPSNANVRQSDENGGLCRFEVGLYKSSREGVSSDRVTTILRKGQDSGLQKQSPSLNIKPNLTTASHHKQKISAEKSNTSLDVTENSTSETQRVGKKEIQFRRTSSCSEAGVSETSFIDVLKKPVLPETEVMNVADSCDSSQGGLGGTMKGKKGRQIDAAVLGFKVSSNRIMMVRSNVSKIS